MDLADGLCAGPLRALGVPSTGKGLCQEIDWVYEVIVVDYPNADYCYYKVVYILLESGNSGEISPSK